MEGVFEFMVLLQECFVLLCGIFGNFAESICRFGFYLSFVQFNGLLQVVNVDLLNVKLIVIMLNFREHFFVVQAIGNGLELVRKTGNFFAAGTQLLSPGVAFPHNL